MTRVPARQTEAEGQRSQAKSKKHNRKESPNNKSRGSVRNS